MQLCSAGILTVCPFNVPLYDAKVSAFEAELFLQISGEKPACRRKLLLHHSTPTTHRHGPMWFYHFPEQPQVTMCCSHGSEWITFSEVLSETGVIHNATACTIAATEIRTLPELHGTSQVRTDVPTLYLPDITPMLSRHEEPKLGEVIPPEIGELDAIKTRLATPPRSWDVDTLFHIWQATLRCDDHTLVPDHHRGLVHSHRTPASVLLCTCTVASLVPLQSNSEKSKGIEPGATDLSLLNTYTRATASKTVTV